ncbi:putative pectinesterase inhibitor domain-containing protein [Helianthus annuus]|uniref:Pectinesterase inhibitor domain-containing protein n=1 Tax=Helianthus annuus TaxID=4232 RepID=A0A9K3GYQ2_HELAN|nr:pectinesterase inhibitor 4-like [Helianthus annuus]KAF5760046.1 putative pectinesterase inhibitor domain-containing protein [Helianthus annuus]KAJ0438162.1 putative pectinesterase inhibitor domain-containing protein [Helianthus annuus]KAJ0442833.1 putative pectinesterase inhibitor domain-containing protein [Helianthus annuus]KAJ0460482.1 putative pectinesterase inhibitor domain-containing protein [Helianthus annuus]KAJ0681682.1 putative pectinesterase inhibitor domain-containing protein [He
MSKSTIIFLFVKLVIFWVVTTILVSALTEDICKESSNPEACKKTIERLKKEKEVDPNNTIRKIINFGLQRSLMLKANMTDWARRGNLQANEVAAIKGCLDAIDVTVDDMRKTLKEVDDLEAAQKIQDMQEFMFHSRNIKTWLQNAVNALQSCQDDDFAMPGLEGPVKQDTLKKVADLMIATQLAIWTIEFPSRGSNRR